MSELKHLTMELFGWLESPWFLVLCGIILFFFIVGFVNDRRKH